MVIKCGIQISKGNMHNIILIHPENKNKCNYLSCLDIEVHIFLLSWPPSIQYGPDIFVICYDLNASLLYQIKKKTSIIL